ncbi:DNA/RNA non-specific endonuclease [Lysinibacillus fusiformis]|uniref:DNA/RNA non-specific endonuclease n=1 Tax=Lysinibacillus fusiformis TaxID=28031 RepID=UPI0037A8C40B
MLKGPVGRVVDQVKKQVVNVETQIQSKVAEVKQQLRQMLQSQQQEFSLAGINVTNIEDTGTVGRNTPTPSPKPSNTQPTPSPKAVNYGEHFTKNGRKKVLKPNVEYKTPEGYTYRTDSNGRITDCEGTLVLGTAERNAYAQRTVGGKDRLPDDDGGHLIGAQFKGPKDIDNLVPQNSQINRSGGEWFNMETEWANALKETPPKKVYVKIEPVYPGNSQRPSHFDVVYEIEGKETIEKTIRNQSGG